MASSHKPVLAAIGAVALGVSLAAFSGSTTVGSNAVMPTAQVSYLADADDPAPADPQPNADKPTAAQPNAAQPNADKPTAGKLSANTASEDAIATALKAAGVASPKRWAAEVVEYRPYAIDDLGLAKLRQNLAKYNPAQGTLDQILSTLLP